jgi:hypothetical protein
VASCKRLVIWDVDDVLNELMRAWFDEWWRPQHPDCVQRYEDLSANPPHGILGVPQETYLDSLDRFREERFASLVPRREVLDWFAEHGRRGDHVALTATPQRFAHRSAEWVMKHFGEWIRTFAFVPAPRGWLAEPTRRFPKGDYLAWLGRGDVFIDDRDDNVAGAEAMGLSGIVVPQPWNRSSHRTLRMALSDLALALPE